ncbi:uncharacterized protein LOC131149455 [Malania oleifera]|uniref:uncharacterized protein LOC131149455 n=1 Tax=Malania oleifera TaxID=397392 RepID=UPI0025AEAE4E|nr:uncharacterized protein LOC131149455 [Malania oleifera]XP_057955886.1 uncharacterized protein LOC131149455 [Malania oleifera]XP_057955887.1 uncharacterized protein LOC131149455 [Malania oleifera]XP_057955888.1 uncharacterized protein LOC131149455 [Malania oleifera]XP_057955889.1 uncharacterized protein LOC131149455 [Malania oleifera]
MQDPRMLLPKEVLNMKTWKKKSSSQDQSRGSNVKEVQDVLQHLPFEVGQKASKRSLMKDVSALLQQSEKSSDSLPDTSTCGNEYRALRRKYLLLEEESFGLGRELREMEDEVKMLEDEKLALLDHLVVLEGLIDPSESRCGQQKSLN